jgi:uncharacterized protein YecT (DUF1311 family)
MTVSYSCPGCGHSDQLSNYICSNCRKYNAMQFLGADNHIPFVCNNCDANHRYLYCPKCETTISLRFVKVVKEESPWVLIIIGLVVLLALFNSGDKNKKQSENIPAVEEPVNDRFGPSEPSTSPSTTAYSPSFDCSRVTSNQENIICGDSELAELDVNLNNAYIEAKNKSADKNTIINEQRTWIQTVRDACSDKDCLKESMSRRIEELSN